MAALARRKAESKVAVLEQRVMELEEQIEEGRMVQERPNVKNLSQHGSNSRQQVVRALILVCNFNSIMA
jgi:hypothetical protein